jgi:hypothetical protein
MNWKRAFAVALLSIVLVFLSSGLFAIFFLNGLFVTGLIVVMVSMLLMLLMIGHPSIRTLISERELEEEEAKEESD